MILFLFWRGGEGERSTVRNSPAATDFGTRHCTSCGGASMGKMGNDTGRGIGSTGKKVAASARWWTRPEREREQKRVETIVINDLTTNIFGESLILMLLTLCFFPPSLHAPFTCCFVYIYTDQLTVSWTNYGTTKLIDHATCPTEQTTTTAWSTSCISASPCIYCSCSSMYFIRALNKIKSKSKSVCGYDNELWWQGRRQQMSSPRVRQQRSHRMRWRRRRKALILPTAQRQQQEQLYYVQKR